MLLLSSVANLLVLLVLPPVLTHGYFFIKKTTYTLYLTNSLNSIIKNHQGRIRQIRVNRVKFRAEPIDTLHLCFSIKAVSKSLMLTLVLSRSLATALKFLEVW